MRIFLALCLIPLLGCNTAKDTAKKEAPVPVAGPASTTSKHPWAKFLELGGFRLAESGTGKLQVKFIAVNHSEADFGEMTLKIRLMTSVAKPGDPALAEFETKISSLGPLEIKDVTAVVESKLRAYEFPDWQFLRGEFDITSPQP